VDRLSEAELVQTTKRAGNTLQVNMATLSVRDGADHGSGA
jgi:hypothetical protein